MKNGNRMKRIGVINSSKIGNNFAMKNNPQFRQNRGDSSNGRLETRDTFDLNMLDSNLTSNTFRI